MFKRKITAFLLSIILFINVPLLGFTSVFADDAIATQNPLFIPITSLVTAVALGTGIVAKNSSEAITGANQLIQNAISNIKSSEIEKSEADSNYDSPYRVINGGQPEKPNNSNKNGKWVALGAGSIASSEIWANKEAIINAMKEINKLNGYNSMTSSLGIVNYSDFIAQASASNIALQLAKISNSAVTQFDNFLHSNFWENNNITPDDCFFELNVNVTNILAQTPLYPSIYLRVYKKNENISKLLITGNPFGYNTYTNAYGSLSYYYGNTTNGFCQFINDDNVTVNTKMYNIQINSRRAEQDYSQLSGSSSNQNQYIVTNGSISTKSDYAFAGYKWAFETPWQFTNNVYNVNQTFDVNFPDWLQESINLLGQQLDAIRLGITTIQPSWNPTQEQIQSGLSPQNVINQYINNYENPEYIPEDEPSVDPNPDPDPEPETEAEPATEDMVDIASQNLWDWTINKITLPDDIWNKVPFCIPYDMYLLIKALFPTGSSKKRLLKVSRGSTLNPDGITISSNFEAYGQNTREYNQSNRWTDNAPVINLDLHFTYHDVSGNVKTFDYVKVVDLGQYGYFAMIIYIGVYITWMAQILVFIKNMF